MPDIIEICTPSAPCGDAERQPQPGQAPTPPPPATIEIVNDAWGFYSPDNSAPVATHVKFGLWDNAFDSAGAVRNGPAELDNFVGSDSRRFYFRVRDPAATTSNVSIQWKTLTGARADDDAPASMALDLLETAPNSHVYVSKAVMLVTETDDRDQATATGLPAPWAATANRGQGNHRLRKGSLRGYVKGTYTPSGGGQAVEIELPIFRDATEYRRSAPLQIFVLRVAAGGAPVIPTAAGSAVWRELAQIRDVYARVGLRIDTVVAAGTPAANIVTVGGDSLVQIDPPASVTNSANVSQADEIAICTANPATAASTMRGIYVGGLATGNRGEAYRDGNAPAGHALRGSIFFDRVAPTYNAAHEMGHILTDASHYTQPAAPAGNRLYTNQNLMRNGTSSVTGVKESKRLWDTPATQYSAIRSSPYTRAW